MRWSRLLVTTAAALAGLLAACANSDAVPGTGSAVTSARTAPTTTSTSASSASPTPAAAPKISLGSGLVSFPNDTDRWVKGHPLDLRTPRIKKVLVGQPSALWLTGDESFGNLHDYVARAKAAGGTMVLTLWNIPMRWDGLSEPSDLTLAQYRTWVTKVAAGIGTTRALVVLEPDALWFYDRLPNAQQRLERLLALRFAVAELHRAAPNARVYVEAGTASGSVTPTRMATLVHAVTGVDGYAINVSSYAPDTRINAYAQQIRAAMQRLGVADPRYVVDTGRNGATTWDNTWCNPSQQKLGATPGTVAATTGQDFRLWVKAPGTSDGDCGPVGAGQNSQGGEFLPSVAYKMISGR